jgi:hypothetical protein
MKIILCTIIFLLTITCNAFAGWVTQRSALSERYEIDEFRIFYSLSGDNALPESKRIDKDNNGIPDFVERIGDKLVSARDYYCNQVGLVHPMESDRYYSKVDYIDINLMKMPLKTGGAKNGMAYDGIQDFKRKNDRDGLRVLAIDISNNLSSTNPTPCHELFHLYQNGYTMYKNKWYTEGTARWAEKIMEQSLGEIGALPKNSDEVMALFKKSYAANTFWNAIVSKVDYENNGKEFMKAFLEEMQKSDKEASNDRGLDPYDWKESMQKDDSNNPYIWDALVKTLEKSKFKRNWDAEIERMVEIPM